MKNKDSDKEKENKVYYDIDDEIYLLKKRIEFKHDLTWEQARDAVNNCIKELYDLKEIDEIIKIPKVDKIKIEDCGIIKNADIEFKDGLNIITGPNASGKTTVINFLKDKYYPNKLSHSEKVMLDIDGALGLNETILIDDALGGFDQEDLIKTLTKLSNSRKQVILTMNKHIDISKIKANIINTNDFELKE